MGAQTCTSSDELLKVLLDRSDSHLQIVRRASDDVSSLCLAKAAQLAEKDEPVMLVCVDEIARQNYLDQLADHPALKPEAIISIQKLCLDIISDQKVGEAIGRKPRVLDENELDVLLEDMKVSGLKPGRLREILKFFFKGISDCDNEHDGWLITGEENKIFAILETNLEVRQAMISQELSSQAYRGMVAAEKTVEPCTIIVDDFGTLSKASQRLIKYLASTSLIVMGSNTETRNADEDYPFLEGFLSFAEEYPDTYSVVLESSKTAAASESVVCSDPSAEFAFVARAIKEQVAQGTPAHKILVATPNSTWKRNIAKALDSQGIPVAPDVEPEKIRGNPRFEDRSSSLKLASFLKLFLDPSDIVALRSWLGLGDWLLRSDAFLELMAYAQDHEMSVLEAIDALRAMDVSERGTQLFSKFDAPLDELDELTQACTSISREAAIELFAHHDMSLSQDMIAYLGDDPAQADIAELARKAFRPSPAPHASEKGVVIAGYRRCHGRHADILFFTGLVNGFLPKPDAVDDRHSIDHKNNALARDRRLFDNIEACAYDKIIRTLFEQDLLENTATMDMQTSRVFIKDDTRFARISPSEFIQTR